MRWRPRSLATRLILGTLVLVTLGCILSAWLNVEVLERELVAEKILNADQLTGSITSATWHAMQAGRKDDAYAVMRAIGDRHGVESILLYDPGGRVVFRSDEAQHDRLSLDSPTCQVCHAVDPPAVELPPERRARFFRGPDGARKIAMVTAFLNEPSCAGESCHPPVAARRILGVLDLALDLRVVDREMAELRWRSFLFTAIKVVLIGIFLAVLVHRFMSVPIRRLIQGTQAVARMDLAQPIEVDPETELGDLASSFELMRQRLGEALAENARFTQDLEHQVEERTQALRATQEQLIQSDRLASLGQLAASVAHEVNNPISAVLNLSVFLQRILTDQGVPPERLQAFRRHLGQIADETARAGRIVTDLLSFSRRSTPRRAPADLNAVVRDTIALVRHRGELAGVEIRTDLATDLPQVPCDRSQVEQVLLNLLLNAIEALKEGGQVLVCSGVETATGSAVLQVEDDGPGIPPEILSRIFDPFFTTKLGEKGVGLGLAVAYGIVEAHQGRLAVNSDVGRGTTFTVRLPLRPRQDAGLGKEEGKS